MRVQVHSYLAFDLQALIIKYANGGSTRDPKLRRPGTPVTSRDPWQDGYYVSLLMAVPCVCSWAAYLGSRLQAGRRVACFEAGTSWCSATGKSDSLTKQTAIWRRLLTRPAWKCTLVRTPAGSEAPAAGQLNKGVAYSRTGATCCNCLCGDSFHAALGDAKFRRYVARFCVTTKSWWQSRKLGRQQLLACISCPLASRLRRQDP